MRPLANTAMVRPDYHYARNELLRPDRTVFCSHYFVEKWIPRLGPTATTIVLTLRALAGEIHATTEAGVGEAAVEVSQETVAKQLGCSTSTFYRELRNNVSLQAFLRIEQRFKRNPKGHVRQSENLYFIAMDDPLLPEDEPRVEEICNRRAANALANPSGKTIVSDVVGQNDVLRMNSVVGQNDVQRHEEASVNLTEHILSVKLTEQESLGTYKKKQVTVTRLKAAPETKSLLHNSLEEWRRTTEELARHSAKELDDQNSLGYHIQVWNHARKHDKQKESKVLTNGVFDILRELSQRRTAASPARPQGRAWTRRTCRWFEDNGVPLNVKSIGVETVESEISEVRAVLERAPFMNGFASPSHIVKENG
jgi:AraC-like DNA-binding protein